MTEPQRLMWEEEPQSAPLAAGPATPPRWRWRWRDLPFVIAGVLVVGTIVTCGYTQIFEDRGASGSAAGCFDPGPLAGEAGVPSEVRDQASPVSCETVHRYEQYHKGRFTGADAGAARPHLVMSSPRALRICAEAARDFLGGDYTDARVYFDFLVPSTRAWKSGDRSFRCVMAETSDVDGEIVGRSGSLRDGLRGDRPLRIGCVDVTGDGEKVETIRYILCDALHTGEFVGTHTIEETGTFPDDDYLDAIAEEACTPLVAAYLGLTPDRFRAREDLDWVWVAPSQPDWDAGDHGLRCFVATHGYKPVVRGSIRGLGTAPLPT
jgi:Septum formation